MHKFGHFTPVLRFAVRCVIFLLLIGGLNESVAQYSGPSILSRGGNLPGRRGRAPMDFSFYGAVKGTAESGLLATMLDEEGQIQPVEALGVSAETGIFGGKNWRRSSLGVDYRGDYRRMFSDSPNVQRFNGWNQVVALSYERTLTRRITLQLSETGGSTNRAFGGFAAPAFGQLGRTGVPLNEVFDLRTDFLQTSGALTWQKSARLAFTGGGNAFFVKRKSFSLVNSQGYIATASPTYRMSRRLTLQSLYQFQKFEFPRLFANSTIHNLASGFQYRLDRNWNLNLLAGVYLMNNRGTEQVQLSPEVAEILGRPVGLVTFDRSSTVPMYDIDAVRRQDRGSLRIGASQVTIPGNGVFLTSTSRTFNAGYSYTGTKRLSLGVSGGYTQFNSQSLRLQNLNFYQAGTGLSYRLTAGLNFTTQFDYRKFTGQDTRRGREGYGVTFGLGYTTSRFPLSIW